MTPGYKTTEFWHALIAQVLAILAMVGVVSQTDTKPLESALGQCITGIFALVVNGIIVFHYIRGRNDLKLVTTKTDEPTSGSAASAVLPFLLGGLVLFSLGSPAQAQSVFPWRSGVLQQMKEHDRQIQSLLNKQQQAPLTPPAPSAPQIIVIPNQLGPIAQMNPHQQFPIQGQPKQDFPIQGQPKQDFPIQGQPKQDFPIQGQPQQLFPIQGQPHQQMPIQAPGPVQPLPIAPPSTPSPAQPSFPVMPPATSQGLQSYSVQRVLSHPIQ